MQNPPQPETAKAKADMQAKMLLLQKAMKQMRNVEEAMEKKVDKPENLLSQL